MPLSEYEQRVLEQMERQLTSDDPRLANTLMSRGRRPVARYAVAITGIALGLLLLVAGAAGSMWWLGVLGFVVMFAAVAFAFAAPHRPRCTAATRSTTTLSSSILGASRRPSRTSSTFHFW